MLKPVNATAAALLPNAWHPAVVVSAEGQGCQLTVGGERVQAAIATHLPMVVSGQRVLAWLDADAGWLVTAAWPHPDNPPVLRYDADAACLHIEATRLKLSGVASVALSCQDARVQLAMDGKVQIEGRDILSSALGSHRIEGASIDLN